MMLHNHTAKTATLIGLFFLLVLLFLASNVYGYTDTTWSMAYNAYMHYDGSNEHLIIRDFRMPRALVAALVGSALAMAGAIMQALTRNPMASPGILGINAGAGFFVVIAVFLLSATLQSEFLWFALAGATVASVAVFVVGSVGREGMTPLKLTLSGATVAAMFSSFTTAVLLSDEVLLENMLIWLAGSVEGRKMENILPVLPLFVVGYVCALLLGKAMNVIAVGEDVATGLGQNTLRVKLLSIVVVILLAGASVSVAGPIGFVGLVIPHIARGLVGIDHRWVIPYCGVLGAILLLSADIGARFIAFPKEVPVGVMTAIVGAPFFIYLARKELLRT